MQPLVYIILVNYNGYNDTVACVQSLLTIRYSNYKIIIVDNASNDVKKLQNDTFLNQNVKLIYAESNRGFSNGNNIGIKYAMLFSPKYVLLLNNDTIVDKNFLSELIKTAENNKNVGIVTGKIYYYSNPKKIWYSGGNYNRKNGITHTALFDNNVQKEKNITFASGCLMLISTKCIKKVGLLSDEYFMYSEDTDYCCKVVDAGFSIIWTPQCVIYHKVSASAGENSLFQQYYLTRNNFIMTKKYGIKKYMDIFTEYCNV